MLFASGAVLSGILVLTRAAPAAQSSAVVPSSSSPTVTVKNGTYIGLHLPTFKTRCFLGRALRATAHRGPRELLRRLASTHPQTALTLLHAFQRFCHPQSLNTSWLGESNAAAYGTGCTVEEDCLTLNIVKPSDVTTGLPVLVWNFGGGLVSGSGVRLTFEFDQSETSSSLVLEQRGRVQRLVSRPEVRGAGEAHDLCVLQVRISIPIAFC